MLENSSVYLQRIINLEVLCYNWKLLTESNYRIPHWQLNWLRPYVPQGT